MTTAESIRETPALRKYCQRGNPRGGRVWRVFSRVSEAFGELLKSWNRFECQRRAQLPLRIAVDELLRHERAPDWRSQGFGRLRLRRDASGLSIDPSRLG